MRLTIPHDWVGGDMPGQADAIRQDRRESVVAERLKRLLDVRPPVRAPSREDFPTDTGFDGRPDDD